jgi:hypothetical protein
MARGIGQLETGSGDHLPLQPHDPNTQSWRAWIASDFLDINSPTGSIAFTQRFFGFPLRLSPGWQVTPRHGHEQHQRPGQQPYVV